MGEMPREEVIILDGSVDQLATETPWEDGTKHGTEV